MNQDAQFIIPNIAYFDPNTYGKSGYAMIGPLLLLFDKVLISNPTSCYIDECFNDSSLRVTALTSGEFFNHILREEIVPLGFETFFNRHDRMRFYQIPPALLAVDDFDYELMSPRFEGIIFRISNNYKYQQSPVRAKAFIEKSTQFVARISQLIDNESLPVRYSNLAKDISKAPLNILSLAEGLDLNQQIAMMAAYDYLNNKYAALAFSNKNNNMRTLHIQNTENIAVYKSIISAIQSLKRSANSLHENTSWKSNWQLNLPILIDGALKTCTKNIPKEWRLTSEKISNFRKEHKESFVEFITSQIKESFNETDRNDPERRLENLQRRIDKKFEELGRHLDGELISLLHSFFSSIVGLPISIFKGSATKFLPQDLTYQLKKPIIRKELKCLYSFLTPSDQI